MIYPKGFCRFLRTSILALLTTVAPLAAGSAAQQAPPAQKASATSAPDLSARLGAIEKAIDEKRKELGIPGASLVIVKDDRVIYIKGLGVRDFERKLPVTPDTLFAIGSASKAFTGLAAVITADEGKLSLADSPKKFLPYFKLRDPEADAKITIRDLLSHRSGLNRTDVAMATNMLNREELIKVVGLAKPTAKLGEKFQYQNVMYAAAGEAVAKAQNSTWDRMIVERIFEPLGMKASNTTVVAMQRSRDFSLGYAFNSSTKETHPLPMREIPAAAPAGAINSSARDMAQWLRFMLNGGVMEGRRLVSEKGFNELVTKQINVSGNIDYGLGWFLRQWEGHKVVEHGGNIDGFSAQVALMPDQKLGFVLLSNVTASPLVDFAMTSVWTNLVGRQKSETEAEKPDSAALLDPKSEVGTYRLAAAGIDFQVTLTDGKLILSVPGQPPYPLENVSGRRYKLAEPAPDGFFATFRPVKGKETETEMYLEQPHGNVIVPKLTGPEAATVETPTKNAEDYSGPLKDVLGSYENEESKTVIEVVVRDGKVSLLVPGQPAYPLVEKEKDKVSSTALPETYWVDLKRDVTGRVTGIVINQPEGHFAFRRLSVAVASMTEGELIAKVVAGYGGEENLRKHKSSVATIELDLENQGVQGQGVLSAKAPNLFASNITLSALGKNIGTVVNYFDGTSGGQTISFAPEEIFSGKRLEDVKRESNFYGPLAWKDAYKQIKIKRITRVGAEEAYVVEKVPEKGNIVTDYISTKSFLLLRRDSFIPIETTSIELPQTEYYYDYQLVDGVMVAFKTVSNNIVNGDIVTRIKDIKFDVEIPDSVFRKPAKPAAARP